MKNSLESCYGCNNFYITHKPERPYGCRAFGFISKNMPSTQVFSSSGTQCAYREKRVLKEKNV